MNLLSRVFGSDGAYTQQARLASAAAVELPPKALYDLLWSYYLSNGLYDRLARAVYEQGLWRQAARELRNPANRVVEVYAAKLLGGALEDALPLKAENERIIEPIERVWEWSNWGRRKQVFSRYSACFGTVFLKVVRPAAAPRVYFQIIHPGHVCELELDERDFVTHIRIDVPITRRTADRARQLTSTEVWDRDAGTFRLWEHDRPDGTETERLGPPMAERSLSAFGIDFVPVVIHKHRDIGEDRGQGSFTHALSKIDEVNRSATRLHQLMFRHNKPVEGLESPGRDADGRVIPPPQVQGARSDGAPDPNGRDTLAHGDDELYRLPAGWTYKSLVPDLRYADFLAMLRADLDELEDDIPELTLARIREVPDASGVAIRYRLTAAIDRILEARGNAFETVRRADMMALTMGAAAGLDGFSDLGFFDAGDLDHDFEGRDVIPLDDLSEAQTEQARAAAYTTLTGGHLPPVEAMRRIYGMTEQEATDLAERAAAALEATFVQDTEQ